MRSRHVTRGWRRSASLCSGGRWSSAIPSPAQCTARTSNTPHGKGWVHMTRDDMVAATPMNWFKSGDLLDRAFAVGIILKGLDGILEVLGGLILFVVSPATIDSLTRALTQHELSQDPHDFLATHLLNAAGSLTGSSLKFGAVYLLLHGVVKIALVAARLPDKSWGHPRMMPFLVLLLPVQLHRVYLV